MADGLVTAALLFLLPLALIGAGVALWVHRPRRNEHDTSPRIQPLFTSDLVPAVDPDDDDERMEVEPVSHADAVEPATAVRERVAGSASFAPPARATAAVRPAMPQRPIAPSPRPAAQAHPPLNAPSHRPAYSQAPAPRHVQPLAQSHSHSQMPQQVPQQASPRAHVQQAWADGQAVRFNVPVDGTLQFLPGRLEIIAGQEPGREVRFVRLPDSVEPEITFGRNEGPLYRHVQLRDATVSRLHAQMVMRGGAWTLTNLSTTNPVMLNGAVLGDGEAHVLADGDRVEMGEVVFRFRTR